MKFAGKLIQLVGDLGDLAWLIALRLNSTKTALLAGSTEHGKLSAFGTTFVPGGSPAFAPINLVCDVGMQSRMVKTSQRPVFRRIGSSRTTSLKASAATKRKVLHRHGFLLTPRRGPKLSSFCIYDDFIIIYLRELNA